MSELDQLISRLRELVDERHKKAHEAIETPIGAFSGPVVPTVPNKPEQRLTGVSTELLYGSNRGSNVDRVIGCLSEAEPKTVDDISEATGLAPAQVRGVLYSIHDSVRSRFKAEKIGKRMHYRLPQAS